MQIVIGVEWIILDFNTNINLIWYVQIIIGIKWIILDCNTKTCIKFKCDSWFLCIDFLKTLYRVLYAVMC